MGVSGRRVGVVGRGFWAHGRILLRALFRVLGGFSRVSGCRARLSTIGKGKREGTTAPARGRGRGTTKGGADSTSRAEASDGAKAGEPPSQNKRGGGGPRPNEKDARNQDKGPRGGPPSQNERPQQARGPGAPIIQNKSFVVSRGRGPLDKTGCLFCIIGPAGRAFVASARRRRGPQSATVEAHGIAYRHNPRVLISTDRPTSERPHRSEPSAAKCDSRGGRTGAKEGDEPTPTKGGEASQRSPPPPKQTTPRARHTPSGRTGDAKHDSTEKGGGGGGVL